MNRGEFDNRNTELMHLRNRLHTEQVALQDVKLKLSLIEAEMRVQIAQALNPETGKALYSNEALREAALLEMQDVRADWRQTQAAVREGERTVAMTRATIEFTANELAYAIARAAFDAEHEPQD